MQKTQTKANVPHTRVVLSPDELASFNEFLFSEHPKIISKIMQQVLSAQASEILSYDPETGSGDELLKIKLKTKGATEFASSVVGFFQSEKKKIKDKEHKKEDKES